MIKELAQYIDNQTVFMIGTDLFAGFIPPDAQDDCVVLIESGGKPNFYLVDAPDKMIQVISRAKDYWTARANAFLIYDLLHGKSGIDLPMLITGELYTINTAEAVAEPQSVGQDERGLFNISTNIILRIRDK